nr:hypothetical protein L204_05951 [Cryptococcus depauperatus CBS 7855]
MIIYWPIKVTNDTYGKVLGLKAGENSWVVVAVVREVWDELQTRRARELGVEMIGQALSRDSNQEMTSGIHFWLGKDQLPESCSQSITLVLFQPPKPNRLQYLTLDVSNKSTPNRDLAMQDSFSQVHDQICLPKAIDLINQVVDIRRALKSSEKPRIIALDRPDDPVLHTKTHLLLLLRRTASFGASSGSAMYQAGAGDKHTHTIQEVPSSDGYQRKKPRIQFASALTFRYVI